MNASERRIVITGMGVLAPNGHGLEEFEQSLRAGKSGIRFIEKLQKLNFRCQVGGVPQGVEAKTDQYFTEEDLFAMNEAMIFSSIASIDAWRDAGLEVPDRNDDTVNWDSGCVIGTGLAGMDTIGETLVPKIDAGRVRRMGSTMVEQTMASSVSAKLSGALALGNQVTTNSSACSTGTEAIHDSFYRIKLGLAEKMLAGGCESSSEYIWGGFDAMRVTNGGADISHPEEASRPMSGSAGGFVPGSGAGVLLVESLTSAERRGARIYAEVLSGAVNCGGHRNGGSMTAPNRISVQRCIQAAVENAGISPEQIDVISGHLTATMADPIEVNNWSEALGRGPKSFPLINSTKSMIGHCLGAAGSIEAVAAVLQLQGGFVHGSINCTDLHEKVQPFAESVVHETIERNIGIIAKASFGFGDVNSCLIFKKWQ
jgi:3-oxoacyl-(acyl-carrier-protein) synthase